MSLPPRDRLLAASRGLLALGLAIFIVLMPLGITPLEVGAVTALAGLAGIWLLDWKNAVVRRYPLAWLTLGFYAFLVFKTFHSIEPVKGWYALKHNWFKGLAMPFMAMELGRDRRGLCLVVWACAAMCLWQGLDGVWQFFAGRDLVYGLPLMAGRLTGSFKTYRVGDLIAMAMVPALALPAVLPQAWSRARRRLATAAMLAPAAFLLVFSQTRSGYICFLVGCAAIYVLHHGLRWQQAGGVAAAAALLLRYGPQRITLATALRDGRVYDLWPLAWKVFLHWPILGAGLGAYNPGFRSLGLAPSNPVHGLDMPHPHNVYLQFLCETGVVGLAVLLAFLLGHLGFLARRLRAMRAGADPGRFAMAAALSAAYLGFLCMAFTGYDFFRSWWLGLAMLQLGAALGGCLGDDED